MTEQFEYYLFTNKWTMEREGPFRKWHLRRADGSLVETDRYRHDIIERYNLTIATHVDPVWEAINKRA